MKKIIATLCAMLIAGTVTVFAADYANDMGQSVAVGLGVQRN